MTFLQLVAEDIIKKYGTELADITIVFPNKRASLFMNDCLLRAAGHPIWSPSYITISDLFRQQSKLQVGDNIKLICLLYQSFIECTGIDESLDHFYSWGQLLLADFDDIDKNLASADKVFANLKNIHELDNVEYLTTEQKQLLQRFFSSFSDDQESLIRERFIKLWSHIFDIYVHFNKLILQQGITYEGALYRYIVEGKEFEQQDKIKEDIKNGTFQNIATNLTFNSKRYLFVGFNVVQKVEQQLFKILKEEDKASFYWDLDKFFFSQDGREAGGYIRSYLQDFPNELDTNNSDLFDNFNKPKEINIISSMTETAQARYVSQWLIEKDKNRMNDGKRTVIVMCNENLLPTIIHCIPKEAGESNITTGYPLQQTPAASLFNVLWNMQISGRTSNGYFNARYVSAVLHHPYIQYISDKVNDIISEMTKQKIYVFSPDELCRDDGMTLLFSMKEISSNADAEGLLQWIEDIIKAIAKGASTSTSSKLMPISSIMQESLFRLYTLIQRVQNLINEGTLTVDLLTLRRIFTQIISSTSIPFHGEPATGIQIMGVLETRNLDFDHVLMLSASEGNIPKGINDTSFIPHSIRKAYGLTTVDNKVAIYAYYFFRLLCRANDITIMYNASTEGTHTGEASRFITQLMVNAPQKINLISIKAGQKVSYNIPKAIPKDEAIMEKLYSIEKIYPTGLNNYLRCQLKFYYENLAGLKEPDEDEEEIDARQFGDVFHNTAEAIYRQFVNGRVVRKEDFDNILKNKIYIENEVDKALKSVLHLPDNRHIKPSGLLTINRNVLITYITRLLKIDRELAGKPLYIKALEKEVMMPVIFKTKSGEKKIKIGGKIDRLDIITDANGKLRLRVVDYKTGKWTDSNPKSVADIFVSNVDRNKTHTDYYLQTMLYSDVISKDEEFNHEGLQVSPALLFIKFVTADKCDPIIKIGKDEISNISEYHDELFSHIKTLLEEIYNPSLPFSPTTNKNTCNNCPFSKLCK
jgi:CRISPR/Cas system-associated exonuclease Cas4 (RecB family)